MRNGGLWRRILCLRWKFQANMFIRFEKYSTVFALSSKAERPGGLCPMTCRPGRWCIIGLAAGCGPGAEALAEDLRTLLGLAEGRNAQPSAAFIDSQTLRLTPESGARAGYDGGKRKKGSKLHLAVDTLGHFLAVHVTPANADDRAEVGQMAKAIQAATDQSVEVAFLDQGYTGDRPARAAQEHGIELEVIKLDEAKRGFILLPRRWVVERSFAWATRFKRLVKDYERCAQTLADLHLIAFVCLMSKKAIQLAVGS